MRWDGNRSIGFIVDNYDYAMRLAKEKDNTLKNALQDVGKINLDKVMEILTGWAAANGTEGVNQAQEELDNILKILRSTNSQVFISGREVGRHIHDTQEAVREIEQIRSDICKRVDLYRDKVMAYNKNLEAIQAELRKEK